MARPLLLTGHNLTRRDFHDVVLRNRRVSLAPRARRAMEHSRALVERLIAEKQTVYGVTTGVGSLSTERIDPEQARQLQLNIVRSHACGVGEPLDVAETRGLLLLRAATLARYDPPADDLQQHPVRWRRGCGRLPGSGLRCRQLRCRRLQFRRLHCRGFPSRGLRRYASRARLLPRPPP